MREPVASACEISSLNCAHGSRLRLKTYTFAARTKVRSRSYSGKTASSRPIDDDTWQERRPSFAPTLSPRVRPRRAVWHCQRRAADAERYELAYGRFCSVFPDTFVVTERARVYLDPKQEKQNAGRLLSAGFHSMTGYFRDDGPLYELILDRNGQRELDQLWEEFDFITGAPMRQYASFLWFERAESRFVRGTEFDFVRAEDKDAGSPAKIKRLAEVYLAKARRNQASEIGLQAITDHFEIIAASIRRVEDGRRTAEPSHLNALQAFAERAFRRPLSSAEREQIASFYRSLHASGGLFS